MHTPGSTASTTSSLQLMTTSSHGAPGTVNVGGGATSVCASSQAPGVKGSPSVSALSGGTGLRGSSSSTSAGLGPKGVWGKPAGYGSSASTNVSSQNTHAQAQAQAHAGPRAERVMDVGGPGAGGPPPSRSSQAAAFADPGAGGPPSRSSQAAAPTPPPGPRTQGPAVVSAWANAPLQHAVSTYSHTTTPVTATASSLNAHPPQSGDSKQGGAGMQCERTNGVSSGVYPGNNSTNNNNNNNGSAPTASNSKGKAHEWGKDGGKDHSHSNDKDGKDHGDKRDNGKGMKELPTASIPVGNGINSSNIAANAAPSHVNPQPTVKEAWGSSGKSTAAVDAKGKGASGTPGPGPTAWGKNNGPASSGGSTLQQQQLQQQQPQQEKPSASEQMETSPSTDPPLSATVPTSQIPRTVSSDTKQSLDGTPSGGHQTHQSSARCSTVTATASPSTPVSMPKPKPAPSGRTSMPRSWANIVATDQKVCPPSPSEPSCPARESIRNGSRKHAPKSIIDCLLAEAASRDRDATARNPSWAKFLTCLENGLMNGQGTKQKYIRRGLRNNANICYLNAVIQAILPCSTLMQLLSNCTQDAERPFTTMLVRVCQEFHDKKNRQQSQKQQNGSLAGDTFDVSTLGPVKDILDTWQAVGTYQFGSQQDAGEFMFYILNGMHEECKWKATESVPGAAAETSKDSWAEVGKGNKKVEVRSSGLKEDSPIQRIFGGTIRSVVRGKNAKADSVTLELFTQLSLDISAPHVTSVKEAVAHLCSVEHIDSKTKRNGLQELPAILILNLKRFAYLQGGVQKIKKAIRYEEKMKFLPSLLATEASDDTRNVEYTLMAVINHHGERADVGHYNALVRYNDTWFMYDDATVRPIDVREVLSQHFAAYLLVYQSSKPKVCIRP